MGRDGVIAAVSQVRRALPPEGWQRIVLHEPQMPTVEACEKSCAGREGRG